ncbi:MAG: pilus assembly protein [Sphingomonadaceae bacterium]
MKRLWRQLGRNRLFPRLARDVGGNTLVIVAAGLVPLSAMIGSGVDMSRAYMAKTRLQSACDAASLAARRAMTDDNFTTAVQQEGIKYFNFNFPQGLYDTASFTPQVTKPETGTIRVEANTTIPTVIMHMFGFGSLPLEVDCEASQNFVNTDIVLVLDVTGSMGNNLNGEQKIVALREAVIALYDELKPVQDELEANGLRLRYGIVPYSTTVNIGKLLHGHNASYIASSWNYRSRVRETQIPAPAHLEWLCNYFGGTYDLTNQLCGLGNWVNGYHAVDTSIFKTGAAARDLSKAPAGSSTWNGCIEERQTVNTITSASGYSIPNNAYDLNIDMIPANDSQRWGPQWGELLYKPNGDAVGTGPCPTEAKRLQAWSKSALQSYVNGLNTVGNTYHDIGMIWGARLISDAGVFADSPNEYAGMPVTKHIIFMTDGNLEPNRNRNTAYGVERYDNRIAPNGANNNELRDRHEHRLQMICNAAKSKQVSIWVVAFDTNADDVGPCASSDSQVSVSTNKDQLIAKFVEIGKNIGALRLSQ